MSFVDPKKRCQKAFPNGQCPEEAIANGLCWKHGGTAAQGRADTRLYRLGKAEANDTYGNMLGQDYKNLRDEIAITRTVLQEWLTTYTEDARLELHTPVVQNLVTTIGKLMGQAHQLEQSMGLLVGEADLQEFAVTCIKIIDEEMDGIPDKEDRMESIASRIVEALTAPKKEEK
jgi:hypothetical protein